MLRGGALRRLYANGAARSPLDTDSRRRSGSAQSPRGRGEPVASNASAFVNAATTRVRQGLPVRLSWDLENVEVNGFDEKGAAARTSHRLPESAARIVASVGIRASWDLGAITPYARFTADKEREKDGRTVSATPLSLVSGNWYDIPAYQPADSSYGTITVGVRGMIGNSIGYGLNYSKSPGRSGVSETSSRHLSCGSALRRSCDPERAAPRAAFSC